MKRRLRVARMMVGFAFKADATASVVQIALSILNATSIVQAVGVKLVVDAAIDRDMGGAVVGAVVIAGVGAVSRAANNVGARWQTTLLEKVNVLVDQRIMTLANDVPTLEHYEQPEYADKLELLRQERPALTNVLPMLIGGFVVVVRGGIALGLLASLHPALALLPLFAVPSLLTARYGQRAIIQANESVADKHRLTAHLFRMATTAAPAKEVRVFGLEPEIERRYDRLWDDIVGTSGRAYLRATLVLGAGWAVFALGFIGAIAVVAFGAVDGHRSPGDVALALSLAGQVDGLVSQGVAMVMATMQSIAAAARLVWLEDYAVAHTPPADDAVDPPAQLRDGISLRGVGFRYPGTDTDVLRDVTVDLPAGSVVAVVGENGAGKTTLVKLLAGMYRPTEGTITVDGVDLADIAPAGWRARLTGGFQDFARLEFVARETVGAGDLAAIDDVGAVTAALDRAGAADVIDRLDNGLDTQLGRTFTAGAELSGGQWQKLALGRAMMRTRPLLLLLDEPTAALDAEAEHELFERYAGAARTTGLAVGGVTVLVSHRFSTVRMADLILVFESGRLIERGTHRELVALGGLYAELFNLQARSYR